MRVALLTVPGAQPPSSCFAIDSKYPKPTPPSQDWVLVRVHTAGLNRSELRQRNNEPPNPKGFGIFQNEYHPEPPRVLGEEFAGEIDTAGTNTSFKPGDRVVAAYYGGGKAYDGAYAEYTLCRKEVCYKLPDSSELPIGDGPGQVSWAELASFPGSGWTAWGSLFQSAGTRGGHVVLVRGATSSVGIWAVLLAKAHGCMVIATTRQDAKAAKLRAAGADHVVLECVNGDDGTPDYEKMVNAISAVQPNGVDIFLELVDSNSYNQLAFKVTAKYGTVVIAGVLGKGFAPQPFTPAMIPGTRKLTMHVGFEITDGVEACFREIALGIRDGVFKREHFLDSVYGLEEVGKAHDLMQANSVCGKVVLEIA